MNDEIKFHSQQTFEVQKLSTLHFFILYISCLTNEALHDIIYFFPLPCPPSQGLNRQILTGEWIQRLSTCTPSKSNPLTVYLLILYSV